MKNINRIENERNNSLPEKCEAGMKLPEADDSFGCNENDESFTRKTNEDKC